MKKIFLILVGFSLLFLSSCIKMDADLVVNNDLTMDGVTTFDYTQLNATSKGFTASFTLTGSSVEQKDNDIKKPCENVESGSGGLTVGVYKTIKCENINDNIAKVTAKGADISKYVKEKDGDFILDLNKIIEKNNSDKSKSSEEQIQGLNMMKSMGFEMNYTIELPTGIIESNIGKIDGKKLSYTVYDLIKVKNPYVIFKNNGNIKITKNSNIERNLTLEKKSLLFKKLILSKRELNKTYKGRKNIQKFDEYIPKMNKEKLVEIYSKLKVADYNTPKLRKYKNLLEYLEAKIGLELYNKADELMK